MSTTEKIICAFVLGLILGALVMLAYYELVVIPQNTPEPDTVVILEAGKNGQPYTIPNVIDTVILPVNADSVINLDIAYRTIPLVFVSQNAHGFMEKFGTQINTVRLNQTGNPVLRTTSYSMQCYIIPGSTSPSSTTPVQLLYRPSPPTSSPQYYAWEFD